MFFSIAGRVIGPELESFRLAVSRIYKQPICSPSYEFRQSGTLSTPFPIGLNFHYEDEKADKAEPFHSFVFEFKEGLEGNLEVGRGAQGVASSGKIFNITTYEY
jgi:hypothetical protein